jgi:hypothetical protein
VAPSSKGRRALFQGDNAVSRPAGATISDMQTLNIPIIYDPWVEKGKVWVCQDVFLNRCALGRKAQLFGEQENVREDERIVIFVHDEEDMVEFVRLFNSTPYSSTE